MQERSGEATTSTAKSCPISHHPTPRQGHEVSVERTRLARVQHDPTHQCLVLLKRFPKRPEAGRVGTGYGAAGLDFQGHEFAILFEDEVNLVSRTISPEMKFALQRVERAPCLQRLHQSNIGVGGEGPDAGDETAGFQQVQVAVRGGARFRTDQRGRMPFMP